MRPIVNSFSQGTNPQMQQTKMTIMEPSQFDDYEPVRCTNINEGAGYQGGLSDLPSKLLQHAAQTTSKKRKKL